jgi:hypothetical protein
MSKSLCDAKYVCVLGCVGSGKSFLMMDLVVEISQHRKVLLVDAEGAIIRRLTNTNVKRSNLATGYKLPASIPPEHNVEVMVVDAYQDADTYLHIAEKHPMVKQFIFMAHTNHRSVQSGDPTPEFGSLIHLLNPYLITIHREKNKLHTEVVFDKSSRFKISNIALQREEVQAFLKGCYRKHKIKGFIDEL